MSANSPSWGTSERVRPCSHERVAGPPELLYAVRHGQSTINAGIRPAAPAEGDDMVIGLTELGERQAVAFGRWLAARPPRRRPDLVLCSPYLRATTTWDLAAAQLAAADIEPPCVEIDGRLFDRYRGDRSRIPAAEMSEQFPDEYAAEQADPLGYRPPGGESFHDVAQRLRGVVERIERDRDHRTALIVAHDAVILMLRALLENLDDTRILAIAEHGLAGNASITAWTHTGNAYHLLTYDDRSHLP